jgi:hypothetical protein
MDFGGRDGVVKSFNHSGAQYHCLLLRVTGMRRGTATSQRMHPQHSASGKETKWFVASAGVVNSMSDTSFI